MASVTLITGLLANSLLIANVIHIVYCKPYGAR